MTDSPNLPKLAEDAAPVARFDGANLRKHMRCVMLLFPDKVDPLTERLWREVQALDARIAEEWQA